MRVEEIPKMCHKYNCVLESHFRDVLYEEQI